MHHLWDLWSLLALTLKLILLTNETIWALYFDGLNSNDNDGCLCIRHITLLDTLCIKDAEKLVHAFFTSRFDYCYSLLSGSSSKSLKTLQLVQGAAARVLTRTKKREHISPVLALLHWLPVSLNNMAPLYLKELIVPHHPTRARRFQISGLLVVPKVSKSRVGGARAFSYQAPLLWNHLPLSVREADTICTFKSRLKTFLYDKAYS